MDDPVRNLIRERLKATGKKMAPLSRKLGKADAYLQQFLTKGLPAELGERARAILAAELEVPEADLRGPEASALLGGSSSRIAVEPAPTARNGEMRGSAPMTSRIPLYGHAAGGKDGQFILNGNKVADIMAPPDLAGVKDAYAVYVVGESMTPRYEPGEAVYVNPRAPVRRGDYVVVQIAGAEGDAPYAFIKRFTSKDSRQIKLEQLNPKKSLAFPVGRVVSVHRIIGTSNA